MANRLILKRSSVAGKIPLANDLSVGEIAVNLADAKLYSKDAGGNVISVGGGGGVAGGAIYECKNTISANYSITSGTNGMSAGPISIATGVTVTVPTGSTWVIV
jgi:hypothetical protein